MTFVVTPVEANVGERKPRLHSSDIAHITKLAAFLGSADLAEKKQVNTLSDDDQTQVSECVDLVFVYAFCLLIHWFPPPPPPPRFFFWGGRGGRGRPTNTCVLAPPSFSGALHPPSGFPRVGFAWCRASPEKRSGGLGGYSVAGETERKARGPMQSL